jgi:hypothetical protein
MSVQISREERALSPINLREPVEVLLNARPEGIGEALLVHMVRVEDKQPLGAVTPAYYAHDHDKWTRKVRRMCTRLGATRDEQGVWRLEQ